MPMDEPRDEKCCLCCSRAEFEIVEICKVGIGRKRVVGEPLCHFMGKGGSDEAGGIIRR